MNVKAMLFFVILMTAGCKVNKDIGKRKSHVDSTGVSSNTLANIATIHHKALDSSRFASFADMRSGWQRQTLNIQFASLSNPRRGGSDTTAALINAAGSYLNGLPMSMLDRITGLTFTTENGKEEKQTGSTAHQNSERVTDGRDSLSKQRQQSTDLSKDEQANTRKVVKTGVSLGWKIGIGALLLVGLIVLGYLKGCWSLLGFEKKKQSNNDPKQSLT